MMLMRLTPRSRGLGWSLIWLCVSLASVRGQVGIIKDYQVTQYYPAPNFRQLQMQLTGSEAVQPTNQVRQYHITQPHFTSFRPSGEVELTLETPECWFDDRDSQARTIASAAPLAMRTGTGDFSITGTGFKWWQNQKTLIISNAVHAVVQYTNNAPPLVITSRWFQFDAELHRGVFYDAVRVTDTNQTLTCTTLTIIGNTNQTRPTVAGHNALNSGGVEIIEAEGPLEILGLARPGYARAQRGRLRPIEQRVDLIGQADWAFAGRSGQAEQFTLWHWGEDIEASGEVRLTLPRAELGAAANLLTTTNTVRQGTATNTVSLFADRFSKHGVALLADGNVRLVEGSNFLHCARLEGRQAIRPATNEWAIATGDVFVGSATGGIQSDRAEYARVKNEILFTGNPRLQEGEIRGTAGRVLVRPQASEIQALDSVAVQFPLTNAQGSFLNILPTETTRRPPSIPTPARKVMIQAQSFQLRDGHGLFTGDVVAQEIPADGSEARMRAQELEIRLAADQRHTEFLQARQNVICERGTLGVTNGPAEYARMDCATLTAQADPATGELLQLSATGGVDFQQTASRAQGAQVVYTAADQILRLIGHPRIELPEGVYQSEDELIWNNANQTVRGSNARFTAAPALLKNLKESERFP
ncbi:MAG: hypothetical protein M9920_05100 [Verrucomicrobiae bacterium]|nr:hypothetical protein [Verrucomicrobiae bacterium]